MLRERRRGRETPLVCSEMSQSAASMALCLAPLPGTCCLPHPETSHIPFRDAACVHLLRLSPPVPSWPRPRHPFLCKGLPSGRILSLPHLSPSFFHVFSRFFLDDGGPHPASLLQSQPSVGDSREWLLVSVLFAVPTAFPTSTRLPFSRRSVTWCWFGDCLPPVTWSPKFRIGVWVGSLSFAVAGWCF